METETDPIISAQRELEEETGLKANPADLTVLAQIDADITNQQGAHCHFTTYLVFYNVSDQQLTASDDLDGIKELTPTQLQELITRYTQLPATIDPARKFAWIDYGQLYGPIHQIALDLTR